MDDLISRQAVIDILKKNVSKDIEEVVITDKHIKLIESVPTAYDAEKVVAEIKSQFGCKDCEYADVYPTPYVCLVECAELEVINDICDIVRKGGVNIDRAKRTASGVDTKVQIQSQPTAHIES